MATEQIHLIGIGGTGMTALAGLLHESGSRVSGSDHALYPPTSTILERLGLEVFDGFSPENLGRRPDLIVVGNAISRGNPELEAALDRDLPYTSMPRLIAERFLRGRHSIVVAGTHGKTTTTAMLACVLDDAGLDPGFLIGGSPSNFAQPFRLGTGSPFVIEGDEYDTAFFDKGPKFMHYRPDTALIGTVEFDHADIYDNLEQIKTVFRRFVNLVPRRGLLVRYEDCDVTREVSSGAHCRTTGYGIRGGQWRAEDFRESTDGSRFRIARDGAAFADVELALAGEHNARNALAVAAAAFDLGLEAGQIARGLGRFKGVRRRLERRGVADGVTILDDFAHHPTAIRSTLETVRRHYPQGRVWAVLEPRSWSMRRRVFQHRLVDAFDAADEIVIAAVYGAGAIPEGDRLDPDELVEDLGRRGASARHLPDAQAIVDFLRQNTAPGDVVTVMSNGAFDGLHERLIAALELRQLAAGRR